MYCPSCEHRLESGADRCDLCGFNVAKLDTLYGARDVEMDQITDTTHFLRTDDKDAILEVIDEFETQFPQFFPSFYLGRLPDDTKLSEFAGWLLNRARVSVLGEMRNSENLFLFVIDLTSRSVTVSAGYFAEQYVSENDLRELLRDATPFLTAGDLREALEKLVEDLRLILKRNHRLLLKHLKTADAQAQRTKKKAAATMSEPSPRASSGETPQ